MTLAQGDLIYFPSNEIFFVSLTSTLSLPGEILAQVKKQKNKKNPPQTPQTFK